MKTNESGMDRAIRVLSGAIILYLGYVSFTGIWQIVAYIMGIVLLFTAITGFCLLYNVFGVNTKSK